MVLSYDIKCFGNEHITCVFTNEEFNSGDTSVAVYGRYKISILLTEGLNAVKNGNVIYGRNNSVLFFGPDELHFGRIFRAGKHSYLDIFLPLSFFENNELKLKAPRIFTERTADRINCINFDAANQKNIYEICREITEIIKSEERNDIKLISLILRIVVLCEDFYEAEKAKPPADEIPLIVEKTMFYISDNYEKELSIKEISLNVNCSVAYLARIFKKHTGMTKYSYITAMRIANAKIMLKTGVSVTDTCFLCGFNDCSNFIKTFKKVTGITPLKFKSQSSDSGK